MGRKRPRRLFLVLAASGLGLVGLITGSPAAFAQTNGFSARLIDLVPEPKSTTQALDFATRLPEVVLPGQVQQDVTEIVEVIDFRGTRQGQFSADLPYPGGRRGPGDGENFVTYVEAAVTIPPGRWQVGLGSDDGGFLQLDGVDFFNTQNENGSGAAAGIGNDAIWYESIRSQAWTIGTIDVDTTTTTRLRALMWENLSHDAMEIAIRRASSYEAGLTGTRRPRIDPAADDWQLLRDGTMGWGIQTSGRAGPPHCRLGRDRPRDARYNANERGIRSVRGRAGRAGRGLSRRRLRAGRIPRGVGGVLGERSGAYRGRRDPRDPLGQ